MEQLDHRQLLSVNFTGNVPIDFPAIQAPGAVVLPDNPLVQHPAIAPSVKVSGFDISGIRVSYSPYADTLSIGLDQPQSGNDPGEVIAGDSDNNGNSGTVNPEVTATPGFVKKRLHGRSRQLLRSTLGELEALAGFLVAELLTLDHAGVTREVTAVAKGRVEVGAELLERPRQALHHRSRLAGLAAAAHVHDDVDPLSHFRGLERGPDIGLLDLEREVGVGVVAVDLELARAFANSDPRHCGLAPACAPSVDFLLGRYCHDQSFSAFRGTRSAWVSRIVSFSGRRCAVRIARGLGRCRNLRLVLGGVVMVMAMIDVGGLLDDVGGLLDDGGGPLDDGGGLLVDSGAMLDDGESLLDDVGGLLDDVGGLLDDGGGDICGGRRLRFDGWLSGFLPGSSRHRGRGEEGAGGCGAAGKRLERDRLLGLVGVIRAHMELELVDHLTAELALGQHPLDCQLKNTLGPSLEQFPGRLVALAGGVPRVALVGFLLPLVAREDHLVHVGDDDVVASVDVGCVSWTVLAHQDRGNLSGEAADDLFGGVDHIPLPRQLPGLGLVTVHGDKRLTLSKHTIRGLIARKNTIVPRALRSSRPLWMRSPVGRAGELVDDQRWLCLFMTSIALRWSSERARGLRESSRGSCRRPGRGRAVRRRHRQRSVLPASASCPRAGRVRPGPGTGRRRAEPCPRRP